MSSSFSESLAAVAHDRGGRVGVGRLQSRGATVKQGCGSEAEVRL
ncbi:MAG: hypothetical protein PUF55_05220 [Bacteroidales bacterium]|nr:hypothetical protein [Bacteroidales bacterium]